MKLPGGDSLIVERAKIIAYLLNSEHRYGASKARFFSAFGFRADDWETFARAVREHGRNDQVSEVTMTGFGPRYEVEGEMDTPDGRRPRIRTVWQLDEGEPAPRLITAYPTEAKYD